MKEVVYMENTKDLKQEILNFIGNREVRYSDIQKQFESEYTQGAVSGALGTLRKKNILSTKERGVYSQNVSIVQALKNDVDGVLKKYDLNNILDNPSEAEEFISLFKKFKELCK